MSNEKVVLITGAGNGLGRALAKAFCRNGAITIGLGRNQNNLQETLQEIKTIQPNAHFEYHECNVSDYEHLTKIIDEIDKKHGHIDYVFNNAAIYPKVNFIEESAYDFNAIFETNVIGVSNVCKLVLPMMLHAKMGRIFNVGSFADINPVKNSAGYSASKGALHALTKSIAVDIAHLNSNVQVFEWIPGHLNTQMSDYTGMAPDVAAQWAVELAERMIEKKFAIFLGKDEWLPPKSLKEKIIKKLQFWRK